MNILCEKIRSLRKERGMTQKELAEKLSISDKTVSRWESGVQLPEAALLPDLSEVFGVSIDELYGIERDPSPVPDAPEKPQKDDKKIILDFKIWMIAGTLISLLGSLLYRYFGSTVYTAPRLIDSDYYNTAKGTTADIFSFVGIIAVFVGIAVIIITKVRFAMLNKPYMQTPVYAVNVRYTGAAVVVFSLIFMKTAPEVLSFGFFLPRSVYGYILVAALTAMLIYYKRQLKKRDIAFTNKLTVTALIIGVSGFALGIGGEILSNYAFTAFSNMAAELSTFTSSDGLSGSAAASGVNYYSVAAAIMVTVSDILVLAMPTILYIELLIKLRKVKEQ